MTILHRLLLAIALALSAVTVATAQPSQDARVQMAFERGKLIYDLDQAAWHGTDTMLERLPEKRRSEIRGWVVEPDGDAFLLLFYGYDGETPYGLFSARFKDGKVVWSHEIKPGEPRALTQAQQQMAAARAAITKSISSPGSQIRSCTSGPLNTVVIPPVSETAPVEVYLLTPQTTRDQYPFGGHYLLTVGPDGKVVSSRPFMKSCLTQTLEPNTVAAMITHLLDPQPTEIHAFLSRWIGKPVYVMVTEPQQLWEVSPAGIRKVDKP